MSSLRDAVESPTYSRMDKCLEMKINKKQTKYVVKAETIETILGNLDLKKITIYTRICL